MWLANLWNHERHAWIQEEEKNCNLNLEKWKRFSAMLLTFLVLSQVNCIFLTCLSEFHLSSEYSGKVAFPVVLLSSEAHL